jgi:hypothetical protein
VHKADHSPSFNSGVNNEWSCMSTSPYLFMVCCIINYG